MCSPTSNSPSEEILDDEAAEGPAEAEEDDPDAHRKGQPSYTPVDPDYRPHIGPFPEGERRPAIEPRDVPPPNVDLPYPDTETAYEGGIARYPDEGPAFPDPPGPAPPRPHSGPLAYPTAGVVAYPCDNEYPDTDAAYPNTDAAYEETDAAYPDTDAAYLGTGAPYPNIDGAYPDTDAAYPDTDGAYPDVDASYPNTDAAYPNSEAVYGDVGGGYAPHTPAYVHAAPICPGVCKPHVSASAPHAATGTPVYTGTVDTAYQERAVAHARMGKLPNATNLSTVSDKRMRTGSAPPPFRLQERVWYMESDGSWVPAVVAHVDHAVAALGGENAYTVRLGNGTERSTFASRLCSWGEQPMLAKTELAEAQAAMACGSARSPGTVTSARDAVAAASARWSTSGSAVSLLWPAPTGSAAKPASPGQGAQRQGSQRKTTSKPASPAAKPTSPAAKPASSAVKPAFPPHGSKLSPARRSPQPVRMGASPLQPPPPLAAPASAPTSSSLAVSRAGLVPAARPRWRPPDWVKPAVLHQPVLEMVERGAITRSMPVGSRAVWILGRHGGVADILLDDSSISRAQAAILNSSSACFLVDLDSAHGTWYDPDGRTLAVPQLGTRLDPDAEPTRLAEGATFRLGSSKMVFRVRGVEPERLQRWAPPPWAEPPRRRCYLEVRSNDLSNPYLQHLQSEGGDVEGEMPITGRCMMLGRKADLCDVVLMDTSVSRQHAVILHAEAGGKAESFVQDLGSASGTFVNGKLIPSGKPFVLSDGDAISLGECKATYTFRLAGAKRSVWHGGGGGASKRQRALA